MKKTMIMGVNGRLYYIFCGYIMGTGVMGGGRGVILHGYGWCYGMAFTAANITWPHRHCIATLDGKNFPKRALYA